MIPTQPQTTMLSVSNTGRHRSGAAAARSKTQPPKRISLGRFPTRLEPMPRIGAELGVDFWIKREYEADGYGCGNKVRKLEFLLQSLIDDGFEGLVVDGTTDSNCAMALAVYAPPLSLSVDLVLYGPTDRGGNYLDITRSRATVTPLPEWSPSAIEREETRIIEQAKRAQRRLSLVPTGATNATTAWAGVDLATELADQEEQLPGPIECVVFPTASGGTQAGLEIGRHVMGRPWRMIGIAVANDSAYFDDVLGKIVASGPFANMVPASMRAHTHMGAIGDRYGVPLQGTDEEIFRLRTEYGLLLDTVYTYKAFEGLRQLVKSGDIPQGARVVFIHTGGLNERFAR